MAKCVDKVLESRTVSKVSISFVIKEHTKSVSAFHFEWLLVDGCHALKKARN